MRLTRVISTAIKKGRLLIKVMGLGSKDVQEVYQILPFGIDSNPVKKYRAIWAETESMEDRFIIGVLFERASTLPGETRIYSEDSTGNEVLAFHFKNDGTCEMGGATDSLTTFTALLTGFNKLRDDHNALVDAFNAHTHPTAAVGPPSTPTPVPDQIPVSDSDADISAAESSILKTIS